MEDRPTRVSRALAGSGVPVKGASAYPGVIITTCTSHLGTVERVTRLLFHSTTFVPVIHSLTERSSEGQPAHTASGEDGTTGKDRLAKTPQARSVVGLSFIPPKNALGLLPGFSLAIYTLMETELR